jgi:hypothetical protein
VLTAGQVDAAVAGLGLAVLPAFLGDPIDTPTRLERVQTPTMATVYTVMPPELRQFARAGSALRTA